MADKDFSLVRGRVMRVTKLDECGNVVPGPRNKVVTKGVISVGFSAQTDEGNTITVTNANGDECIRDQPAPRLTGYTLEIAPCGVIPSLVSIMTGQDLVTDADDDNVGFDIGTDVDLSGVRFALELWSKVPGGACIGGIPAYGYFLAPYVQGGQFGDFTWQNDAVNFTVSGAVTQDGNAWGTGPYDVLRDENGDPSPLLSTLSTKKHLRVMQTTLEPPTDYGVGAVGTLATGATAGIPGTYTPANSYGADDLAGMVGIVANPAIAWTTGQYVDLAVGTPVYWTGAAWAAGVAP